MRRPLLVLALAALALAGPSAAWAGGNSPGVRFDPNFPPLGGPGVARAAPAQPNRPLGTVINCDQYGRCWQQVTGSDGARPPGWADNAPARARNPDRFARPQSGVVCDRRTSVCYKNGRLDRSETKNVFGDRASDRVAGVRKRNGTGQLFLPDPGVTCNSIRKVCYDGGIADFSQTRRYFGDRAANALN